MFPKLWTRRRSGDAETLLFEKYQTFSIRLENNDENLMCVSVYVLWNYTMILLLWWTGNGYHHILCWCYGVESCLIQLIFLQVTWHDFAPPVPACSELNWVNCDPILFKLSFNLLLADSIEQIGAIVLDQLLSIRKNTTRVPNQKGLLLIIRT